MIRALAIVLIAVPAALADEPADLVLTNGTIVTVDGDHGTVEALAARDGRILAVGTADEIAAHVGDDTEVIDLDGRLAIPGFIEGHGHFVGLGQAKMNLDLMHVKNWAEVIALVEEAVAHAAPGEWIVGRGWHQEKWDRRPPDHVEGFPVHHDLSAVSPDNPVHLTHASGHASFANKKAMDVSGISASTPDPPGGDLIRDASGNPTGALRETASGLIRVRRGLGGDPSADLARAVELAERECLSKGVTSFQDAGSPLDVCDALAELARAGELDVRLWMMIRDDADATARHAAGYKAMYRMGDGFYTVGGIKRSIDGALGARGAWLLEPYADSPESVGLETTTVEEVTAVSKVALQSGLQMCVHAIGDRANREVLDIFEMIMAEHPDRHDLRWRIEHAQHLHPDDIPRFGALGVIASMQGIHCTSDAPWVYARLGAERAEEGAYVWRKLMDTGAIVTNGTDAPVEDVDPIASFDATVTRRTKDGSIFFPEQRMTRMEALRSYTINAAFAAFEDDVKGTLTPGKYADVVVLTKNIMTIPDDELREARVALTIVGGKVAYIAE